jgi:NifB/MoaA-like Fe-S oxidoreductase
MADRENINIDVLQIVNEFFGPSVTVAGLLTGRDIIRSLHDISDSYDILLVPNVVLKEDENLFLDNVSLQDIEETTGLKTITTDINPQSFMDTITNIN